MSLPATYAFGDGSGTLPGDFTIVAGSPQCDGAGKATGVAGDNTAYWDTDSFDADQYSIFTYNGTYAGPAVRVGPDIGSGVFDSYALYGSASGDNGIFKVIDGSYTRLNTLGNASNGDVYRLQVVGSTLSLKKNGVDEGSPVDDGSLSSGSAGFVIYSSGGFGDDWEGGNVSAGNFVPSKQRYYRNRRVA